VGFSDIEAPTFSRQSAYRWRWDCQPYARHCRLLPPGRFLVLISVKSLSPPQGHSAAGRVRSIENFHDFVGNRTRYLPAFSTVPPFLRYHSIFLLRDWRTPRRTTSANTITGRESTLHATQTRYRWTNLRCAANFTSPFYPIRSVFSGSPLPMTIPEVFGRLIAVYKDHEADEVCVDFIHWESNIVIKLVLAL
jgi:hypothetical protein